MKFAEELFPKGTFKHQETDGAYINETLASNLDIIAKKIVNDMHFLGIITGHDMVGDGKTTCMTQVGTYLTWKVNQLHKTNNTFTDKNLVFSSSDLATRSFELPPYSVLCLDEGDDLTIHGMKELAVRLKRYFRKCRQLNQILILILPSFFELPKFYALSRSHFLIDVFFQKEYERGYFKFYSPHSKKLLYLKGKKEWDYDAYKSDFKGRFFSSYTFFPDIEGCVNRYKKKKYEDMITDADEVVSKTPQQIRKAILSETFRKVHTNLKEITVKRLAEGFGVSKRTATRWLQDDLPSNKGTVAEEEDIKPQTLNYTMEYGNNQGEEEDNKVNVPLITPISTTNQ